MLSKVFIYPTILIVSVILSCGFSQGKPQPLPVILFDTEFEAGSHGFKLSKVLERLRVEFNQEKVFASHSMGLSTQIKRTPRKKTRLTGAILIFPLGVKSKACELGILSEDLLLVAIGVGVDNPFVPNKVNELCPQQLPKALLIGEMPSSSNGADHFTSKDLENQAQGRPVLRVTLSSKSDSASSDQKIGGSSLAVTLVGAAASCSAEFAKKIRQVQMAGTISNSKDFVFTQKQLEDFCLQ